MKKNWIVVTTINKPTIAIDAFSKLTEKGWAVVVVGDLKTPKDWTSPGIVFLSVNEQDVMFGDLSRKIPYNHYCRKNLGYLYAITHGAQCILETDDDNIPYDNFGQDLQPSVSAFPISGSRWINIYKYFTSAHIWPRGLPLDEISTIGKCAQEPRSSNYPIQQFLADEDPDVDAIYRLVLNKPVIFDKNASNYELSAGSWTPFNSQNTVFYPEAFPLLYLPCHVSFRMTDIWRSFVAQRVLWVNGHSVVFRAATVRQVRNEHNLQKDFIDEIPGYTYNKKISDVLDAAAEQFAKPAAPAAIARALWKALFENGIIPDLEMAIIDSWLAVLESIIKDKTVT
jgi:hypothetical protein